MELARRFQYSPLIHLNSAATRYTVGVTQYNVLKRPPRGGLFSFSITLRLVVDFVAFSLLALRLSTISDLPSEFALYMELVHVLDLFPVVRLPSSKL